MSKIYLVSHHETDPTWKYNRIGGMKPYVAPANYYKIGVAKSPESRVRSLSSGTPHILRLVTTVGCDDAKVVENQLHRIYSGYIQRREWFKLTSNAVNSLVALEHLDAELLKRLERQKSSWLYDSSLYVAVMKERERQA